MTAPAAQPADLARALSEVTRQRDLLLEKLAALRGAELAKCELLVAQEHIRELEEQLARAKADAEQMLQKKEAEWLRVRNLLEEQLKEEQEGRQRDRLAWEAELHAMAGVPSATSAPTAAATGHAVATPDSPTAFVSTTAQQQQQQALPSGKDRESSRLRRTARRTFMSMRGSEIAAAIQNEEQQRLTVVHKTASDDSSLNIRGSSEAPPSVGRPRAATKASISTSAPGSPVTPPPLPLSPQQRKLQPLSAPAPMPPTTPATAATTATPPAAALSRQPSGFRDDVDGLSTLQRGQQEVVLALVRRLDELWGSIERTTAADDPSLRPRVEAALQAWRILSERPLSHEDLAKYQAPRDLATAGASGSKLVQLKGKVHRCVWETRQRLAAINAQLAKSILRRQEEIAESRKIAQLLRDIRAISFMDPPALPASPNH